MITRWNTLDYLTDEDEIAGFLDAAIIEGDGDADFFLNCLSKASEARAVNRISKELGVDRKMLCDMFQKCEYKEAQLGRDVFQKAAKAFLEPSRA